MTNDFRWAMVGDLQIPYQDNRAVALFLKAMRLWKPHAIDFVGDIDDQLEYSSFSNGTTDEFFSLLSSNQKANDKDIAYFGESAALALRDTSPINMIAANAQGAKDFYSDVRKDHPDADLHSSLGNHDIRIFGYIDKKAPEYNDQVTPNSLWGLDDMGITWRHYDLPPLLRFADMHVHHGKTASSSGLSVKADIDAYGISLIRGHDHKGGVVYQSYPLSGLELSGMGTGHLCDPSAYGLSYTVNPAWQQGFGIAHVVDGKAYLQFIHMKDYTVVLDGVIIKG